MHIYRLFPNVDLESFLSIDALNLLVDRLSSIKVQCEDHHTLCQSLDLSIIGNFLAIVSQIHLYETKDKKKHPVFRLPLRNDI